MSAETRINYLWRVKAIQARRTLRLSRRRRNILTRLVNSARSVVHGRATFSRSHLRLAATRRTHDTLSHSPGSGFRSPDRRCSGAGRWPPAADPGVWSTLPWRERGSARERSLGCPTETKTRYNYNRYKQDINILRPLSGGGLEGRDKLVNPISRSVY